MRDAASATFDLRVGAWSGFVSLFLTTRSDSDKKERIENMADGQKNSG